MILTVAALVTEVTYVSNSHDSSNRTSISCINDDGYRNSDDYNSFVESPATNIIIKIISVYEDITYDLVLIEIQNDILKFIVVASRY